MASPASPALPDPPAAAAPALAAPALAAPTLSDVAPRNSVDYVLRTIQQVQVHFSAMADAKANIMITVCSIMISILLTQIARPDGLHPSLLTLAGFTTIALVMALLSVLPDASTTGRRRGRRDPAAKGFNPLFFAHMAEIPVEAFEREMARRLADPTLLLDTILRDIHAQGVVLAHKKYLYLRLSYLAFLLGLAATAGTAAAQAWWALRG